VHLSGFFCIYKIAELKQIAAVAKDLDMRSVTDYQVEVVLTNAQDIVVGPGERAFEFKITF
jgi:hypothetical protein